MKQKADKDIGAEMLRTLKDGLIVLSLTGLPILIIMIICLFVKSPCELSFRSRQYILVNRATEVPEVEVRGYTGRINIGGDSIIPSSALLIGDIQRADLWRSHGPIVSFTKEPYRYKLGDLEFPYELSKKANNDTIAVYKDGYEFKFFMRRK